ncbi:PTS lactose/cellobiose transporter subunit IIA [Enterococcus phoeniculicola]|jgi:PTS system cellobiose-specific IIA component|uniref:PTS system, lactose-specific IIa component n=1 Tax=Enterococcus phoeniculicola ATCC BAA-412 TaxID=1158610 RepID=R3WP44_9ENTE|nr:PTS lactose/cellobiose transporter subunit IIA [Enterococcus phoeniculicola]EOL49212.1 hypothetical protein UC3_00115 [Enterococcus phoeniculicola ATCC BAA-412]EOT71370.1 hypothetical protein I589_03375 [Enterococcus phoeniculicola ATCC BAA-412]
MELGISRDQLTTISMNVILHAGNARDLNMSALDMLAKSDKDYDEIKRKMDSARKEINQAHKLQTDMIQLEANDKEVPFSVLFIHAQDTLMTITSEVMMTEKIVTILKNLEE